MAGNQMRTVGNPTKQLRARWRVSPLVLVGALLLAGCGPSDPPRELPDQPPLEELQALDVCALLPVDDLAAEFGPGVGRAGMWEGPGTCTFDSPLGPFWMELAPDRTDLKHSITHEQEDVEVQEVEGGSILEADPTLTSCLSRDLISDTGYILEINGGGACETLDALGKLMLRNLAESVPMIEWPEGSAGRTDLCAAAEQAKVAETLGVEEKGIRIDSANRFTCVLGNSRDLRISFGSSLSADPGAVVEETQIGGRPALVWEDGCSMSIDLGENAVLAERLEGGHDSLEVEMKTAQIDIACDELPAALDGLVESLAH